MFITVDDVLINLDHIDLIEPSASALTITLCYAGSENMTILHYPDINALISTLQLLVEKTNAVSIEGTLSEVEDPTPDTL